MEGLNKVNKAYFCKDGEVIFLRNDKKIAMICPFSQNNKNCSHHCPLLVEMYETATMETSEKYVKFCNGELIELVGDERKQDWLQKYNIYLRQLAARYVWATLDSRNVAYQPSLRLGGDSAGRALCATVAHHAQYDAALPVEVLVLIYPSLDYTMSCASIDEYKSGFLLQKQNIKWYFDNYFQHGEDRKKASPLFMDITPSFPGTFVVTAGFSPLKDEGQIYVQNLHKQGIRVEHIHFPDLIHAFLNMECLFPDRIQELYSALRAFLK